MTAAVRHPGLPGLGLPTTGIIAGVAFLALYAASDESPLRKVFSKSGADTVAIAVSAPEASAPSETPAVTPAAVETRVADTTTTPVEPAAAAQTPVATNYDWRKRTYYPEQLQAESVNSAPVQVTSAAAAALPAVAAATTTPASASNSAAAAPAPQNNVASSGQISEPQTFTFKYNESYRITTDVSKRHPVMAAPLCNIMQYSDQNMLNVFEGAIAKKPGQLEPIITSGKCNGSEGMRMALPTEIWQMGGQREYIVQALKYAFSTMKPGDDKLVVIHNTGMTGERAGMVDYHIYDRRVKGNESIQPEMLPLVK